MISWQAAANQCLNPSSLTYPYIARPMALVIVKEDQWWYRMGALPQHGRQLPASTGILGPAVSHAVAGYERQHINHLILN